MSQCERLLNRLQVAPITPLEAWSELGIESLAARVFDLKESGHNITTETISVANRFGKECRVARYRLVSK